MDSSCWYNPGAGGCTGELRGRIGAGERRGRTGAGERRIVAGGRRDGA